MRNGLDAAWISEPQRLAWHEQWAAEFDALRARFLPSTPDR
jgi:adenosine deaminase